MLLWPPESGNLENTVRMLKGSIGTLAYVALEFISNFVERVEEKVEFCTIKQNLPPCLWFHSY